MSNCSLTLLNLSFDFSQKQECKNAFSVSLFSFTKKKEHFVLQDVKIQNVNATNLKENKKKRISLLIYPTAT